jgi:transcriptional regulator NrdR family protein
MIKNRQDLPKRKQFIVQKRNGQLEPFSEKKMARSVSRAGTPFLVAKDISKSVENTNHNCICWEV